MTSPPRKNANAPVAAGARRGDKGNRNDGIFTPRLARVNAPTVRPLVGSLPRATWRSAARFRGRA